MSLCKHGYVNECINVCSCVYMYLMDVPVYACVHDKTCTGMCDE